MRSEKIERRTSTTLTGMKTPSIKKTIDLSKLPPEPGLTVEMGIDAKNEYGCTRLIYRAREGDVDSMRKLISAGADVDACSEDGMTALHWAAKEGHIEAVKLLLENGADAKKVTKSGESALVEAVAHGHKGQRMLEIVKLLVENGANVNERGPFDHTPLFWAAMNGSVSIGRYLMDKGAVLVATKHKETPLDKAAGNAYAEVLDLFLHRGSFTREEIMHAHALVKSSGRHDAWRAMSIIERYL